MEIVAYNVHGACTVLGVKRTKLYELMADGSLDARKIGNRTVISAESIRRYFAGIPAAPIKLTTSRGSR